VTAPNTITLQIGGALELILRPPSPAPSIESVVTVSYEQFSATAKGNHMGYKLPVGMMIQVQVSYVDAEGNPAEVDAPGPVWDTASPSIVEIKPDQTNNYKCEIRATGKTGSAQVTATADADMGEGTKSLITTLDLDVVAGEAVAGQIDVTSEPMPID
jgi:hypothetical protein